MTRIRARTVMRLTLILVALITLPAAPASAQGTDRDLENDGTWDFDRGGTDHDRDNDDAWDY